MREEVYLHLSREDVIRYRLRLLEKIQAWAAEQNELLAVVQAHARATDIEALSRSLGTEHLDPVSLEVAIQEEFSLAGCRLLTLFTSVSAAYRRYDDPRPPSSL